MEILFFPVTCIHPLDWNLAYFKMWNTPRGEQVFAWRKRVRKFVPSSYEDLGCVIIFERNFNDFFHFGGQFCVVAFPKQQRLLTIEKYFPSRESNNVLNWFIFFRKLFALSMHVRSKYLVGDKLLPKYRLLYRVQELVWRRINHFYTCVLKNW